MSAMWSLGRAPAANDWPDDPSLELSVAIESIADRLYAATGPALRMPRHDAQHCGAAALLERLSAAVDAVLNVIPGSPT